MLDEEGQRVNSLRNEVIKLTEENATKSKTSSTDKLQSEGEQELGKLSKLLEASEAALLASRDELRLEKAKNKASDETIKVILFYPAIKDCV